MKTNPIDILLFTICVSSLLFLAIVTAWTLSIDNPYHVLLDFGVFLFSYGAYTALLLAILRKIRPYPIGTFSMDSPQVTYWKLVSILTNLAVKAWHPFTTVFNQALVYAAFGARVGKEAAFGGTVGDLPLIEFGDSCIVGADSVITAHAITHDQIVLKPVWIGANAVVGVNCVVLPGVTLGENAVLAPGAVATVGTEIPANELWGGIPARKIKDL